MMTIDERAAAATAEINIAESNEPSDYYDGLVQEIIARHIREAVAEQAELRERVRELARGYLRTLLTLVIDREGATETKVWMALHPVPNTPGSVADQLLQLAEEAGVWFDDDGNEWSLDKWRARMGGAG